MKDLDENVKAAISQQIAAWPATISRGIGEVPQLTIMQRGCF